MKMELFGIGANMCSPHPAEQLFIEDKRDLSNLSHADLRRLFSKADPLLVIDAQTPIDGGIWYLDGFAEQLDVDEGLAENLNTLYKIRMDIRDVVITHANYSIANTDIRNDLESVDVPYPIPEDFVQKKVFRMGFDYVKYRYVNPTWVTATPVELEESTNGRDLDNFIPRPEIVYRIKEDIAREAGLKSAWMIASDRSEEAELPDGTKIAFPPGSKIVQSMYDPDVAIPVYEKPEGSL
ncbi:hypothetical protein J4E89_004659 [Alternaria sp. Ai002NY15]|nr:hypothetical protein J4E89_004659 [Alternaria sp. Ai002NY15]